MLHNPNRALLGLLLLATAVRIYNLGFQSLWRDEVDVIRFSSREPAAIISLLTTPGENGPLYYLFHHYWLGIFGVSETVLRLPSILFGIASVLVIYRLGQLLLDEPTARVAALVAALSPYYVWYSQDGKMYPLLLLLTCLSVYLYLRALAGGKAALWLAFVGVTSLGLYIHFFMAIVILTEGVLYLVAYRFRFWRSWAISMGFLTLPYVPLALWQLPTLASPPESAYPPYASHEVLAILLTTFVRGFAPIPPVMAIAAAALLLILPFFTNSRLAGLRQQSHVVLLGWLVVPVASFMILNARMPLFTDRYLIIASPAFYLLIAAGIAALGSYHRWLYRGVAMLWLGISLAALAWQAHTPLKADFRAVVAAFDKEARPEETVIFNAPYLRHTFEHYHGGPVRWANPPYAAGDRASELMPALMRLQVAPGSVVWLVTCEPHLWDGQQLARAWLLANSTRTFAKDFPGVRLERYQAGTLSDH